MADDEIVSDPFAERNFGAVMQKRIKEADEFYNIAIPGEFISRRRKNKFWLCVKISNLPGRFGAGVGVGGGVCERISKVGTSHDAEILIGTLSNSGILGGSFFGPFFRKSSIDNYEIICYN